MLPHFGAVIVEAKGVGDASEGERVIDVTLSVFSLFHAGQAFGGGAVEQGFHSLLVCAGGEAGGLGAGDFAVEGVDGGVPGAEVEAARGGGQGGISLGGTPAAFAVRPVIGGPGGEQVVGDAAADGFAAELVGGNQVEAEAAGVGYTLALLEFLRILGPEERVAVQRGEFVHPSHDGVLEIPGGILLGDEQVMKLIKSLAFAEPVGAGEGRYVLRRRLAVCGRRQGRRYVRLRRAVGGY